MSKVSHFFRYVIKSGFVRSVFLRVVSIFMVVSIAIVAIAFSSFTTEIRKNILADRLRQLSAVEETISKRMEEITSIAYNVSTDSAFYLEPIAGDKYSGYEMSNTLARYLVGNNFIEHLAYYRLAEPDKIYISSGERSLSEFFGTSFGLSKDAVQGIIQGIQGVTKTELIALTYGEKKNSYFAYVYPLPQMSEHPRAFVLMLIPVGQVTPLLETLLANSSGEAAVFNAGGEEIFRMGQLGEHIPLEAYARGGPEEETYTSDSGTKYILQKVVSQSNGWVYVSIIRQSDTLSGLANRQLVFIILLLLLVFVAIIGMLVSIIIQYRPISNLAETMANGTPDGGGSHRMDERVLLSNTLVTLRNDSEQKQRFETAFREAEAASKAKSAFLSNMSHDIRTPMNAIIGLTAIALRHADDPDSVRDCLQKVQTSSRYLLDIINNVLDMSRIESGRFALAEEVVNLPALIDALVALTEPGMAAKSQTLNMQMGEIRNAAVLGDSVRLTQVFVNILSNSVKFTPEGGTISLGMRQTEPDGSEYGTYIFTFADTGIGMSPEFVGKVFDTFSRADGTDVSRTEGTGLGMAIAKNLVELMGGAIACQSELGRGTTFTVKLRMKFAGAQSEAEPAGRGDAARSLPTDAESGIIDLEGKRILLVEDNAINREIAHRILSETKAEVAEAFNGKEAVDIFAAQPAGTFDLILMDLQMPVMDGYKATAAIRSLPKEDARTVLIYAMTASTFDEDVRQVKAMGMNGHIGKPYTPETLYQALAQALR